MATSTSPAALRKAAILISTLDERTADALLDQMGPDQAARVRYAIMQMDEIPADEQERVIAEFLGRGPTPAQASYDQPIDEGVELAESLTQQLEKDHFPQSQHQSPAYVSPSAMPAAPNRRPFEFLRGVDPAALARVLEREQPQTIAVVLAHLPPEQVADLLACLPAETSIEALGRMARLDDLSADVLADIERELEARLPHLTTARLQPQGVANIQAALDVLDDRQRRQLLDKLGRKDARLLRRLGYVPEGENPFDEDNARRTHGAAPSFARFAWPAEDLSAARRLGQKNAPPQGDRADAAAAFERQPTFGFEQFVLLNDQVLQRILDDAEPRIVELALTGAEERLVRRFLRLLPTREAAEWRRRLDRPGQLRLRDIDQARQALARLVESLARDGEIKLPKRGGFAAAV